MRENGLIEVHGWVNEIDGNERDKTYEKGTKQIDAVLATEGLLNIIRGSKLVDYKEIINSDHRGFIVNIDINDYFSIAPSDYDYVDNVILDPTKRSHRENFMQRLNEYIDQLDLEETVNRLCNSSITEKEIDRLDDSIVFVLDSARKYFEGNIRTVPLSSQKMKRRTVLLYYKALKNKAAGKNVDEEMMERRRLILGIEVTLLNQQQVR